MKRLAFVSAYCLLDHSSGAAIATGDALQLLAQAGLRCEAFCAAKLDFREDVCLEETLSELGLPWEARQVVGAHRMKLVFTCRGWVPVTIFRNQFTRAGPTAEAMTNAIPVVASRRGALPEMVGEGGIVLDLPARCTPPTGELPTAEEVEPWVETIVRLWDDAAFYRLQSEKAIEWSQRWSPECLGPVYADFFRNVHPQPGPPIARKAPP